MGKLHRLEPLDLGLNVGVPQQLVAFAFEVVHAFLNFVDSSHGGADGDFGRAELLFGFGFLGVVLGDAHHAFDDFAAFAGRDVGHAGDGALQDDVVAGGRDAGDGQRVVDVGARDAAAVQAVDALAVAEDFAGDGDRAGFDGDAAVFVVKLDDDFGGLGFFEARVGGAVENQAGEVLGAHSSGAELAEDEEDGVDDVGFAAAVRSRDDGEAFVQRNGHGFGSKGLETF